MCKNETPKIAKDIWEVKKKKGERMTHPTCYYDIFQKHSNKSKMVLAGGKNVYIYICVCVCVCVHKGQWDRVYSTRQRGKEREKEKFDI